MTTSDVAAPATRSGSEEIGMDVEALDEASLDVLRSLSGRLRGGEPGPSVALNGHLDMPPIPDEPGAASRTPSVYGRGSADIKGALACAAEAARVLEESGLFPGRA